MKKTIYIVLVIFFTQAILFSCNSIKTMSVSRPTDQPKFYPVDTNWSDSLAISGQDVKNALLKFYSGDLSYINKRFNLSLTKEEFENLKVISVETYKIDSTDFKNLNDKSSIYKMLKLVKTEAECFLLKDSDIILNMEQKLEKGQWRVTGIGRIFQNVGNQIKTLYFKENIKVHDVIVSGNKRDSYEKRFVIFVRNMQYLSIEYGTEVPLIENMLKYKARLERNEL